jgi:hypothetical protein
VYILAAGADETCTAGNGGDGTGDNAGGDTGVENVGENDGEFILLINIIQKNIYLSREDEHNKCSSMDIKNRKNNI